MEFLEDIDKSSNSWIDKYRPMKINEIIGNTKSINQIIIWLKGFDNNKKEYLLKNEKNKNLKKKKDKAKIKAKDKSKEIEIETETDKINKNNNLEKSSIIDNLENAENTDNTDNIDNIDNIDDEISEPLVKISSYNNNEKSSCLLITGNHGCGKTCSIYAILNDMKYSIQVINFSRIKTNKNIKDIIDRVSNKNSILNNMFNKKSDKSVIVIDELESLASQTEKSCITALIKNNEQYWIQPIIFISNNQHNKLLGDIKKISYEIKFWQPYPEDVAKVLQRICNKTNIKLENNNVMLIIIDFCQKDYRKLIMTLQDIKMIYGDFKITEEIINEYITSAKKKDTDFDLFKATKNLLFEHDGIEESLRYYEIDKTAIPLMTQQNYINCINTYTKNNNSKEKIKLASKISSLISKADIIENFIHSEMSWDINISHAFFSSVEPSYLLDKHLMKNRNCNLVYPLDLNKYSIKRINKINIDNVNKIFDNMDIEDYVYLNQIVREQINLNSFKDCVDNFKDYKDFKIETLERLLKVDKIKCSKTNLKSKDKKEIIKYLYNKPTLIKHIKSSKENVALKK